jgi:type IV pilus biogenesis protein CpaD/CtpE
MLRSALVALCAATIATGAMAQSTGVAVCDEFLKEFETCVTKLPANLRDQVKGVLDTYPSIFAQVVKEESGNKSAAERRCREMAEGVKSLLKRAGCTFERRDSGLRAR